MQNVPTKLNEFSALVDIVSTLRGKDGCPWDKIQTHQSLVKFAIEEVFELASAIEQGIMNDVKEELGDVLLQVVLHAQLAKEAGYFSISDVIATISQKMLRRHPHVFANVPAADVHTVKANWEKIKHQEKLTKSNNFNLFDIPLALPALQRAQKIGTKTENVKFDWQNVAEVFLKVQEELHELSEAINNNDPSAQADEIGDLLFSIAQLARHLKIDSEQALRRANHKFELRYAKMIEVCKASGKDFTSLPSSAKESLWQQAKKACKCQN